MEFFAVRRSDEESDAMMERINAMIHATGFGFYAMENRETGEPMGFCGVAPVTVDDVFAPVQWKSAGGLPPDTGERAM